MITRSPFIDGYNINFRIWLAVLAVAHQEIHENSKVYCDILHFNNPHEDRNFKINSNLIIPSYISQYVESFAKLLLKLLTAPTIIT